ncbi:hypothetical protein CLAFUW4_14216 [Fulvia fulva]|uniref:Uncharacterized protein n=1 Tax=Passalora fulva TaxID=5499 RepID=A0A9Q8PLD2_PASFU|nr:uncharacterized protein CLAFUR5_14049 [Fulvia fulva]KAK4610134.1 hypothetical protein CLAFUR4_14219 [Fulvia fulva]KAK4611177.1 hypothetical protein CLAFUR0_14224 [Fulvia fulva]UJO24749.1 hypothetical protein CLAFUR5_14049 [Fulvia fulva]WPV22082.1 hypothetical protein CLAFUW4_14216 [Fulvia fulva]WPV37301.1 hypothetical protein CLAFUW7_14227 [Fulvia fulva]
MSLYLIPSSKYAQWTPLTAITDSFQDWSALMPQKKISKNSAGPSNHFVFTGPTTQDDDGSEEDSDETATLVTYGQSSKSRGKQPVGRVVPRSPSPTGPPTIQYFVEPLNRKSIYRAKFRYRSIHTIAKILHGVSYESHKLSPEQHRRWKRDLKAVEEIVAANLEPERQNKRKQLSEGGPSRKKFAPDPKAEVVEISD